MNVAFVINSLTYGGAETQLVAVATGLKARGWAVKVICLTEPEAFTTELKAAGIPVETLHMRRGVPDPRGIFRLARLITDWKPDIVHSHIIHANLMTRVTRLVAKFPVLVCTAHNIKEAGRVVERAYRLTDPLCDVTTIISRVAGDRYIRDRLVPQQKLRVVPNGVDTTRFRPIPEARHALRREMGVEDRFVWLAVGRFEEQKDYPNLLAAFHRVAQNHPEAVLLLAGQGPRRREIEEQIAAAHLSDQVRLLGVRKDIPELLSAADGYVMSSAWEGLPIVLLEAGACALPVVATDVGGNREVIQDGKTGLLVEPRDPQLLATRMSELLAMSPRQRAIMGELARARIVQEYDLTQVISKWEDLYCALAQRKERT